MGELSTEHYCECGHSSRQHSLVLFACHACECRGYVYHHSNRPVPIVTEITSPNGGKRDRLRMRFDFLPGQFTSLSWIARVTQYGIEKKGLEAARDYENWKKCDPQGEQSPLNHAIGHALEASELKFGTLDRVWALSKAAWNLLAQIWFEMEHYKKRDEPGLTDVDAMVEKWFEHKSAPKTYGRG